MINYIIIVSIVFVLMFAAAYWVVFMSTKAAFLNMLTILLLLPALVLNYYGKTIIAAVVYATVMMAQFFILPMMLFSTEAGIHLFYICTAPVSFLLWDFRKHFEKIIIIIFSLLSVILFLYCEWFNYIENIGLELSDEAIINKILYSFSVIIIIATLFSIFGFFSVAMNRFNDKLDKLASVDSLTGTMNRRVFFEKSQAMFSLSKRNHLPISVLAVDIDHFKQINDNYGHPVGDKVIKGVAKAIDRILRKSDLLARIGGEEFAVLLPDTSEKGAMLVGEKVCEIIENMSFRVAGFDAIKCSVSVGAASINSEALHFESLIKSADQALYESKRSGRNRCTVASAK